MKWLRQLLLAAATLGLAAGASAQTVLSGVKFEDSLELHGTKLQLNGAGIRYKGPFKVYAAGLYAVRKVNAPEELLAQPGHKRMSITMLREIDSAELGKLFSRGMEDNMDKAAFSKLIPGVLRMSQLFSDCKKLVAGDTFTIDWVPGTGTLINVKCASNQAPFKEPEFFNALMRIWLGPNPADWRLKEQLLGKAA